jgi:hypothetical protein
MRGTPFAIIWARNSSPTGLLHNWGFSFDVTHVQGILVLPII